jgi:hypothetical protein
MSNSTRNRHGSALVTLPSDNEILITEFSMLQQNLCSMRGQLPTSSSIGGPETGEK